MITPTRVTNNQDGMVAIVIVSVLMIVISLITLSYATTTRREQRQALDAQLASQAFYAAESGLNMVAKKLQTSANPAATKKESCDETAGGVFAAGEYSLDSSNNVALTCVLINPVANPIVLDSVTLQSKVQKINTNGENFDTIGVAWKPEANSYDLNGCTDPNTNLPPAGGIACDVPILRVDLVDVKDGTGLKRSELQTSQFTAFFKPHKSTGTNSIAYSDAKKTNTAGFGQVSVVKCSATLCSVDINLGSLTANQYAIRVMALYGVDTGANVQITAKRDGQSLPLYGAQAVVDVTARAQDVLKRVQARIRLTGNSDPADFAIGVDGDICKLYKIYHVGSTTNDVKASCDTDL